MCVSRLIRGTRDDDVISYIAAATLRGGAMRTSCPRYARNPQRGAGHTALCVRVREREEDAFSSLSLASALSLFSVSFQRPGSRARP